MKLLGKGSTLAFRKNFKFLKYKHIIYHFKARDLEISLIYIHIYMYCFARYLDFLENANKTDCVKSLKVFIKSQNLNISQKYLHIRNFQITCFKTIYNMLIIF